MIKKYQNWFFKSLKIEYLNEDMDIAEQHLLCNVSIRR